MDVIDVLLDESVILTVAFETGVAEKNMADAMSGFAKAGK